MLGAIAGDVIGSIYEFDNILTEDSPSSAPTPCPPTTRS